MRTKPLITHLKLKKKEKLEMMMMRTKQIEKNSLLKKKKELSKNTKQFFNGGVKNTKQVFNGVKSYILKVKNDCIMTNEKFKKVQ